MQIRKIKSWRGLFCLLFLLMALHQLGTAGLITAKAQFAQLLINGAWQRSLNSGGAAEKPWPWADTWPVARLEVPRLSVDLFVLWGAKGNSLAFGPGYDSASAIPGRGGVTVIGGHRDTHFEFLRDIEVNTLLSVQLPDGESVSYLVSDMRVVDIDRDPYLSLNSEGSALVLVTCYPFDALLPGGTLRYVVTARAVLNSAGNSMLEPAASFDSLAQSGSNLTRSFSSETGS
jgi:sortase A